MSQHVHPEDAAWGRRLFRAWLVLVALTILSVTAALLGHDDTRLSLAAVLVTLAASFLKARQVLDHFLDLRRAGSGWQAFFTALLVLILGGCLGCYVWAM
ncbi:MAG: cytochrome C oxidase subunit IV family protein [Magnetospirillum sp.]|nr:cytochrome C oxidase subunit IV family protein [Magnetospirillum sp.]